MTIRDGAGLRLYQTMDILCIFASIMAFLRTGIDFRLIYGRQNDFGCEITVKFKSTTQALGIGVIYTVLWLRQRMFYEDPKLKHLSSKFTRMFSLFVIIFLLGSGCVVWLIFIVGVSYKGTPIGCTLVSNFDSASIVGYSILVTTTSFIQISLLCLFIYPLIKHYQNMKSPNKGENPLIIVIKRATITAFICIVTDAITVIIVFYVSYSLSIEMAVNGANYVIDLACLLASYPNWRGRLMPWIICEQDNSSETATDTVIE